MGRMSRLGRRIFCQCSSAGLVVRVVTVLLIYLLAMVGRGRRINITVTPYAASQSDYTPPTAAV